MSCHGTKGERNSWRPAVLRGVWKALLVAAMSILLAAPAGAREAVREDFEGLPEGTAGGREGKGFVHPGGGTPGERPSPAPVRLTADLAGTARGAFSFDLQRSGEGAPGRQTVFTLHERGTGRNLAAFQVDWETEKGLPLVYFRGNHINRFGLGLWPMEIRLERPVAPGEWIHVDLTWDDEAKKYGLFVNGLPQDVRPRRPNPLTGKEIFEDPREEENRGALEKGKPAPYGSEPFSALLSRVGRILLGLSLGPGSPGTSHMTGSVLDNFTVYADEDHVTGEGLSIASLTHDAAGVAGFSHKLVAGDTVTVTMEAAAGVEAAFDVLPLADYHGEIPLSWKGWGVYLEEITFFEEDQVDLGEVEEYRVYASREPLGEITPETPYVERIDVQEQSVVVDRFTVPGGEGEEASLEFLEPETPYYIAVMALMEDGTFRPVIEPKEGMPMTEVEGSPGVYEGTFTVGYGDCCPEAVVLGRVSRGEASVGMIADEVFEIDARLSIEVLTEPSELKADETSTAEVKVTVTDANGDPVRDHEIRFVLATTSQYTGVVGGGAFLDEVGGSLGRDFTGETNMFGEVEMTYTAGFAAKTAIIVARDMVSNDTGAGYVTTYINAAAELELEAVQEVAGKALGYAITVTSSDEWLTADGESEARITALVTRDGIPVEGHRVSFEVSSGAGSIRTVKGETGSDGKARAVYRAGKKIGMVLITAKDHTVGISGSVQIELRSDAPAKIVLAVEPDLLPADGRSTADIEVVVTDINDNPNEGVEVEYAVVIGSGELRRIKGVTNRAGESSAQYVAGRLPGKVSVEVTVRSTVPTEEEMAAARDLALAVPDYDFF